jgi:hypothetical protein
MTIQTREINDAANGKVYAWDGLSTDPLPSGALILNPETNAVFDARDGRSFGELPATPLVHVPRTTWYTDPLDGAKVIGYVIGPHGCVPLYAPKDHDGDVPKPRRNWRQRKLEREQERDQEPEQEE